MRVSARPRQRIAAATEICWPQLADASRSRQPPRTERLAAPASASRLGDQPIERGLVLGAPRLARAAAPLAAGRSSRDRHRSRAGDVLDDACGSMRAPRCTPPAWRAAAVSASAARSNVERRVEDSAPSTWRGRRWSDERVASGGILLVASSTPQLDLGRSSPRGAVDPTSTSNSPAQVGEDGGSLQVSTSEWR